MSLDELSFPPLLLGTFCSCLHSLVLAKEKEPGTARSPILPRITIQYQKVQLKREGRREKGKEWGGGWGWGGDREEGEREKGQMSGRERGKGQGVRGRASEKRSSGDKELPSQAGRGKGVGGWETGRRVEGRGEKGEARPGGQSWSSFLLARGPASCWNICILAGVFPNGAASSWTSSLTRSGLPP